MDHLLQKCWDKYSYTLNDYLESLSDETLMNCSYTDIVIWTFDKIYNSAEPDFLNSLDTDLKNQYCRLDIENILTVDLTENCVIFFSIPYISNDLFDNECLHLGLRYFKTSKFDTLLCFKELLNSPIKLERSILIKYLMVISNYIVKCTYKRTKNYNKNMILIEEDIHNYD